MPSPTLYRVNKIPFTDLIKENYYLVLDNPEDCRYSILQQDNMLFRQVRIITSNKEKYNPYVLFVDCKGQKNKVGELTEVILNGFYFNGKRFVLSERSASMSRNSILSFVENSIAAKLNERITMGMKIDKTVLSKYLAYRGLMFSSCFCLENWFPKVIVVDDYEKIIPDQDIKFLQDETIDFVDKNGQQRTWVQKTVTRGTKDIVLNAFDGCGLHHPSLTKQVKEIIGYEHEPTTILWRAPTIKGVTHQFDYTTYLSERGVEWIEDLWHVRHSVYEPMIILTKSMYKGYKYFYEDGTARDWENYWAQFHRYNHCLGVAKVNFSQEQEPAYTTGNYQILQDLDLEYEDFKQLADRSMDYIEKVIQGEPMNTYHFLGLMADKHDGLNNYMRAILKNPEMMREVGVRKYMMGLLHKKIDEMKCGKFHLDATFKFLAPDLIMLVQHIGGLPQEGVLESDEFWSKSKYKEYSGEYLIERNPHISAGEHIVLNQNKSNELLKWCGHLDNVCMINSKSIVNSRLNGAD